MLSIVTFPCWYRKTTKPEPSDLIITKQMSTTETTYQRDRKVCSNAQLQLKSILCAWNTLQDQVSESLPSKNTLQDSDGHGKVAKPPATKKNKGDIIQKSPKKVN